MRAHRFTSAKSIRAVLFICTLGAVLALLTAGGAGAALPKLTALQTKASPSITVGTGSIHDTAEVIGNPLSIKDVTGLITFNLYGPNDTNCSKGSIQTSTADITGKVSVDSASFTPTLPGTYQYVASYGSGGTSNPNNYAPQAGKCGDTGESVQVTVVTPTVTTQASPSVPVGTAFTDSAMVNGGMSPTGNIVFQVYGPGDTTCSKAIGGSKVAITDPTQPTVSGIFTPSIQGTYEFVAFYSGDAVNGAAQSACGDPNEMVVVTAKPPPVEVGGGTGTGPGGSGGTSQPGCDVAATARAVLNALAATLTGGPGAGFRSTCSAGLRIVLRAKEIRPGNRGYPRRDGFTTMANTLTHIAPNGPALTFVLNANGVALRNYALNKGKSLTSFLVVHVRPDKASLSTEAVQILTLG
jgi:hypothetical protein